VSIQLKNLEKELGRSSTSGGGEGSSHAGGISVFSDAEDIIRKMEALSHRVGALKTLERGALKMGSIDAASVYVLPTCSGRSGAGIGIDVQVIVADSHTLLAALGSGRSSSRW